MVGGIKATTCAMRWMMTNSSLAVRCAQLGSSSHLRNIVRTRCRMEGSVVPARTDCPGDEHDQR